MADLAWWEVKGTDTWTAERFLREKQGFALAIGSTRRFLLRRDGVEVVTRVTTTDKMRLEALRWTVLRKEAPAILRALDKWGSCVRQNRVDVRRASRTRVVVTYHPDAKMQHCDGLPPGYDRI